MKVFKEDGYREIVFKDYYDDICIIKDSEPDKLIFGLNNIAVEANTSTALLNKIMNKSRFNIERSMTLDIDSVRNLSNILSHFYKVGSIRGFTTVASNTTERGFIVLNFDDIRGVDCSVQESSLVETQCIWCGPTNPQVEGYRGILKRYMSKDGEFINSRMHIPRNLAGYISAILRYYIKHNRLPSKIEYSLGNIILDGIIHIPKDNAD